MDADWNCSFVPGTLVCLLCKGVVKYKNGDNTKYVKHLKNEHSVSFHHDLLLAITFLDKETLQEIVKQFDNTAKLIDEGLVVADDEAKDSVKGAGEELLAEKKDGESFGDVLMEDVEAKRSVDMKRKTPATKINPAMPAFKCDKCGKCFPAKAGLYNHRVKVHKIQEDISNLSPLKIAAPSIEKITPSRNYQLKTDALIKNSTYFQNNPEQISTDQLIGVNVSRAGFTRVDPSLPEGWKVKEGGKRKQDDFEFMSPQGRRLKSRKAVAEYMKVVGNNDQQDIDRVVVPSNKV